MEDEKIQDLKNIYTEEWLTEIQRRERVSFKRGFEAAQKCLGACGDGMARWDSTWQAEWDKLKTNQDVKFSISRSKSDVS